MEYFENEMITIDVGGRLRQLRTERGKSMRALARESGLSTNALSMIERGRTSPSVSTLYKISSALEIPITAFFRLEPPKQEVIFCQPERRKKVSIPKGVLEGLGGELFSGRIEPFELELEPAAESGPFGMIHSGSEFVMCLEGRVEYEIDNERHEMYPGCTLIFAAQHRHRWKNIGKDAARLLIVQACFEHGERPSEFHLTSSRIGESEHISKR